MKRILSLTASILVAILTIGHAADSGNLLTNPALSRNGKESDYGWKISEKSFVDNPDFAQQAKWGAVEQPGGNCLMIATNEPTKANVWWQQDLKATGGSVYEVSVEVKGEVKEGSKYGNPKIGIHFMDENGQWLGFEALPDSQLSADWKTFKGKITAPPGTASMGLRLGVLFDGEIEVFFRNPSLSEVQ